MSPRRVRERDFWKEVDDGTADVTSHVLCVYCCMSFFFFLLVFWFFFLGTSIGFSLNKMEKQLWNCNQGLGKVYSLTFGQMKCLNKIWAMSWKCHNRSRSDPRVFFTAQTHAAVWKSYNKSISIKTWVLNRWRQLFNKDECVNWLQISAFKSFFDNSYEICKMKAAIGALFI